MDQVTLKLDDRLLQFVKKIACNKLGTEQPTVKFNRLNDQLAHITLTFHLKEELQQDDWQLIIEPAFIPSFHWAPHLTPTDEHIIDQHSFRSPAIIVQDDCRSLALIPDLHIMLKGTPVRWYMDNDASRNLLKLGMSEYQVKEHVLYERKPGAVYAASDVTVGLFLMTHDDSRTIENPWRPVLQFLWKNWGTTLFQSGAPLDLPLERLVQYTYRWAFHNWEDSVWQEFDLDGKRVGAAAFIVNVTQSPNYPGPVSEREFRSIWNQAWFSSLRSATGVFRYGMEKDDPDLIRRARLTKELALSAPQREGIFPTVIATEMEQVFIDEGNVNRSKGWETAFWGNSNRNPVNPWKSVKEAPYHVLDMSWTALWMLRWYSELEQDERLLAYATRYADRLLQLQDQSGFFPSWLDYHTLKPISMLLDSPETSLSATFLFKLFELTGCSDYADAAIKAVDAVARDVIPTGRWEDFETYWSCCTYGNTEYVGRKFSRNNMYKQCNFSMFWSAEAFLRCYRHTGNSNYLKLGERCLDEMLMSQASWQPPYIHVNALGGFGVMNCDGEWNDARQSLFAELIVEYGNVLERQEYIERGIAALRCAFVMMFCPENQKTKAQWEKVYPFFNEKDYGFMMENYGHSGEVNANGLGIGEFTIFDWGNGAAAESYLRMKAHHRELMSRYKLCEE
jgi:rhamnogalacturonyl hydrolase YesR